MNAEARPAERVEGGAHAGLEAHRLAARVGRVAEVLIPIAIGLTATVLVILVDGQDPFELLGEVIRGTLFTRTGLLQTFATATPLALTALCFALGVRCGVFNIGAEGAAFVGAAATLAVGASIALPPGLHHAAIMLASIAAGALWLAPVAFLKAKRHVHEVVSTVMLNFVALYLLSFLISWPLRDRSADMGAFAHRLAPSARFPVIESPLTIAMGVAVIGAIVMYVLMLHTRLGMRIRAVGFNIDAAQMAGIPASRMNTLVFAIGGAVAGLAGCVLVAGLAPQWTISDDLSAVRNFGILGIAVAMIARHNPLGCLAAAFFVAAIRTSRYQFQKLGVTAEVTDVFIGAIIFAFAFPGIAALIGRHLAFRRHARLAVRDGR